MKFNSTAHLCYSLNVFPHRDEGYIARVRSIISKMCDIRRKLKLTTSSPFALGLWLDAEAVNELKISANLAELKRLLSDNNFYIFTINAFPYGKFHNEVIKERVYLPDWSSKQRLNFTCDAADILAELLPDGVIGSLSTLPGAYKFHSNSANLAEIAENLTQCANHLADIKKKYGKTIILGIEMEPDCIWENPQEFCEFRKKYLTSEHAGKLIGVCYDTSHQELVEGAPGSGLRALQAAGVPIAKIQMSTALRTSATTEPVNSLPELAKFADPIYLHQTRFFDSNKKIITSFRDLSEICTTDESAICQQTRSLVTHFHLPVFLHSISANLAAATEEMDETVKILKQNPEICSNIEIETYTYSVLPNAIKPESTEDMILKEYLYILNS